MTSLTAHMSFSCVFSHSNASPHLDSPLRKNWSRLSKRNRKRIWRSAHKHCPPSVTEWNGKSFPFTFNNVLLLKQRANYFQDLRGVSKCLCAAFGSDYLFGVERDGHLRRVHRANKNHFANTCWGDLLCTSVVINKWEGLRRSVVQPQCRTRDVKTANCKPWLY